jgi:hypothetical protein
MKPHAPVEVRFVDRRIALDALDELVERRHLRRLALHHMDRKNRRQRSGQEHHTSSIAHRPR